MIAGRPVNDPGDAFKYVRIDIANSHDSYYVKRTKYEPTFVDNTYKVFMKLTIKNVSISDFGTYKCIAKNSLGETDGAIKLYQCGPFKREKLSLDEFSCKLHIY
ncbi:hypothetical protein YQE_09361, partial [Dendroctonus ponderosae]